MNSAVSTIVVRGATSAYCATHLSPLPLLFCSLDRLVFVSVKLLCFPLSFFFFLFSLLQLFIVRRGGVCVHCHFLGGACNLSLPLRCLPKQ